MGGISRRKQEKRLKRRLDAFLQHGAQPSPNPGGNGMLLRRPGSNTK